MNRAEDTVTGSHGGLVSTAHPAKHPVARQSYELISVDWNFKFLKDYNYISFFIFRLWSIRIVIRIVSKESTTLLKDLRKVIFVFYQVLLKIKDKTSKCWDFRTEMWVRETELRRRGGRTLKRKCLAFLCPTQSWSCGKVKLVSGGPGLSSRLYKGWQSTSSSTCEPLTLRATLCQAASARRKGNASTWTLPSRRDT